MSDVEGFVMRIGVLERQLDELRLRRNFEDSVMRQLDRIEARLERLERLATSDVLRAESQQAG